MKRKVSPSLQHLGWAEGRREVEESKDRAGEVGEGDDEEGEGIVAKWVGVTGVRVHSEMMQWQGRKVGQGKASEAGEVR